MFQFYHSTILSFSWTINLRVVPPEKRLRVNLAALSQQPVSLPGQHLWSGKSAHSTLIRPRQGHKWFIPPGNKLLTFRSLFYWVSWQIADIIPLFSPYSLYFRARNSSRWIPTLYYRMETPCGVHFKRCFIF